MARPPILQELKHGKILAGGAFRLFVETWNWLVHYADNLKGDADLNPANGHVKIDRTDPDNPVVRLVNLTSGSSSGGMADDMGCFRLVREYDEPEEEGDEPTLRAVSLANNFCLAGAQLVVLDDDDIDITSHLAVGQDPTGAVHTIAALEIPAAYGAAGAPASLVWYATLAALQAAQARENFVTLPLYAFDKGGVVLVDFRRMPCAQIAEVFA